MNVKITRADVPATGGKEPGAIWVNLAYERTIFQWELRNHKRFKLFGKEAVDVTTRFSVVNQDTGKTFLTRQTAVCPLASVGQKVSQEEKINEFLSDGDYVLTFVMEAKGIKPIVKTKSATVREEITQIA